ncbi:hypothetical protein BN874_1860003 [Candidatus Contendobacter odensis Run_B_J11]|uniref:Uncharacterized protein n=1 Tax=Candidatus Contendobacter odensis Run_B_J11 TaxID=1400861 RepID=A0A7U7J3V7_9GAMM|nr:hypothetical protein BN874_1860003 [Candidatus Contendobacter odensis Run_B_J11]
MQRTFKLKPSSYFIVDGPLSRLFSIGAIHKKQQPCRKIAWIVEWMETGKTSTGST